MPAMAAGAEAPLENCQHDFAIKLDGNWSWPERNRPIALLMRCSNLSLSKTPSSSSPLSSSLLLLILVIVFLFLVFVVRARAAVHAFRLHSLVHIDWKSERWSPNTYWQKQMLRGRSSYQELFYPEQNVPKMKSNKKNSAASAQMQVRIHAEQAS